MQLRPYQGEAADAIESNLDEHGSTICVMATGLGKTVVLSEIVRRCPGRSILFTHREELLWQGRNKLQVMMPHEDIDIEMAEFQAHLRLGQLPKCVVASVQSLHAKRLAKFNPNWFDQLIFDECHHLRVKNSTTYGRILEHFSANPRIKILGVTATPDRHDGKSLGNIFKSVAYDYSLPQAIRDGYLVPVQQNMVTITSLDLSTLSTYMGDLPAGSLDEVMSTERNLLGVAYPTLELTGDKKTLIFTAGVHQAHRLSEILNREKPGCAKAIDGGMGGSHRRDIVESYGRGDFQYLVNCNIATEGFDSPAIACVVMARPTKSRPLYSQMLGRGTRILPGVIEGTDAKGNDFQLNTAAERIAAIAGSAKPHLLVIDFTGNSGKHRLIHPADVLGGTTEEPLSDEITDIINSKVSAATAVGESLDVSKVISEAKLELEAKKRLEALAEQERVAKLREVIRANVQYSLRKLTPMEVFDLAEAPKGNVGMNFVKRPTEGQVKSLREMGVDVHHDQGEWWIGPPKFKAEWKKITQGTAGKLLNSLKERRKKDLCSYKQAMLLAKFGEDPHCTFKEAKSIIDEIAAAGWKARNKTVEKLTEEQMSHGAEHVKYKWVEKRSLTSEALTWIQQQLENPKATPEKRRYLENMRKLNHVPNGCPVEKPLQVTQEKVLVSVPLPKPKPAPVAPKTQQSIGF